MRRLLIVSYFFPPSDEVAGKPTARLVRRLVQRGWQPTVLVPPVRAYLRLDEHSAIGLERIAQIERTGMFYHPFELFAAMKILNRRLRGFEATRADLIQEGARGQKPLPRARLTQRFRRAISEILSFPDRNIGWTLPAAWRACELMRRQRFDAIMSISPVVSAHLVARLVRRRFSQLPWLAQFHDPWSDNPFHNWNTQILAELERRMEKAVVCSADRVLCASEEATEKMRARYPALSHFRTLHNGYAHEELSTVGHSRHVNARLTFTYAGALYGPRDPRPFLAALGGLIRRGNLSINSVHVRFIGDCQYIEGSSLQAYAKSVGLQRAVEILAPMSHDQAVQYLIASDVLLVFAERQPLQVPAKLYEYLCINRRILAFADGATARIIQDTASGYVVNSANVAAIEAAILALQRDCGERRRTESDALFAHYSCDNQADLLVHELNASVAERRVAQSHANARKRYETMLARHP